MKKHAWKVVLTLIALAVVAACTEGVKSQAAPSPMTDAGVTALQNGARSVTGNAVVTQLPGVVYRQIINARKDANGEVSGTLTVHLMDLSGFGEDNTTGTLVARVTCLEFAGDSVWFGATTESASDKQFLDPALAATLGQIRSADGVDYGFGGPALFYAPPGTTCTERPALPITPVTEGHYTIR